MEISISAIIVIYNKRVEDSITCRCLQKIDNCNIHPIIVDNSEVEMGNAAYCASQRFKYISMGGNKGLSKAYNAAINMAVHMEPDDILVFFDDDTEVSQEYFEKLNQTTQSNPEVDIFVPIVYGQDGIIYSPNSFNFLKNRFISTPDDNVPHDSFNAIASCMAVRKRIFNEYRFNETLFVDQIDQYFFCEQRELGRKFMKIDAQIYQNFYQRERTLSPEAGWRRLRLRVVDIIRHARLMGGGKYIFWGFIKCCGLGIQIGKKSGSLGIMAKAAILSLKTIFQDRV